MAEVEKEERKNIEQVKTVTEEEMENKEDSGIDNGQLFF